MIKVECDNFDDILKFLEHYKNNLDRYWVEMPSGKIYEFKPTTINISMNNSNFVDLNCLPKLDSIVDLNNPPFLLIKIKNFS